MNIKDEYGHYFAWCPQCRAVMVMCGKCGNNTCNAGRGTLEDGSQCDVCESAYELMFHNNELAKKGDIDAYKMEM